MKKETVLVLGASGMVGSKFIEAYSKDFEVLIPDENEVDLTDETSVKKFFDNHSEINSVVNFAAYTNVSEAQKMNGDRDSVCWKINVLGAQNLAAAIRNRFLVQISTDMVFPGDDKDRGPYAEDHSLAPDEDRLTWYGYTKAKAEELLTERVDNLAILRLIYPVTKEYELKMDYLRGPLSYFEKNGQLYPIFSDQQMNISDIDVINLMIREILVKKEKGIFHAGAADVSTPYKIIKKLFKLVYGNGDMVKEGNLKVFLETASDPTRYPMYGGLVNRETQKKLGVEFASCEEIVEKLYR